MTSAAGIAFQSYSGSNIENVGHIIPTSVVNHFVDDYVKNGKYTGFPALGVTWQQMENKALKSFKGLTVRWYLLASMLRCHC